MNFLNLLNKRTIKLNIFLFLTRKNSYFYRQLVQVYKPHVLATENGNGNQKQRHILTGVRMA